MYKITRIYPQDKTIYLNEFMSGNTKKGFLFSFSFENVFISQKS